jgi:hypothetical protein
MKNNQHSSSQEFLLAMSQGDLKELGVGDVGYVRHYIINGQPAFVLHAADGAELAVQESETAVKQSADHQDLNLVTVH